MSSVLLASSGQLDYLQTYSFWWCCASCWQGSNAPLLRSGSFISLEHGSCSDESTNWMHLLRRKKLAGGRCLTSESNAKQWFAFPRHLIWSRNHSSSFMKIFDLRKCQLSPNLRPPADRFLRFHIAPSSPSHRFKRTEIGAIAHLSIGRMSRMRRTQPQK